MRETGKLESGRLGDWRLETGRLETGKLETGRLETGKLETGKLETGKLETGKLETGKLETGKLETGKRLVLERIQGRFAVARLEPDADVPDWAAADGDPRGLLSITRTRSELSIVTDDAAVPSDVRAERGFAALAVAGTLDFALTGILARLTAALADAGVSVFAISTYDTDVLLVKEASLPDALRALSAVASIGEETGD